MKPSFTGMKIFVLCLVLAVSFFHCPASYAAGGSGEASGAESLTRLSASLTQLMATLVKVLTEAIAMISEKIKQFETAKNQTEDGPGGAITTPDNDDGGSKGPGAAVDTDDGGSSHPAQDVDTDDGGSNHPTTSDPVSDPSQDDDSVETAATDDKSEDTVEEPDSEESAVNDAGDEAQDAEGVVLYESIEELQARVVELVSTAAEEHNALLSRNSISWVGSAAIFSNLRKNLSNIAVEIEYDRDYTAQRNGIDEFWAIYRIKLDDFLKNVLQARVCSYGSTAWTTMNNMVSLTNKADATCSLQMILDMKQVFEQSDPAAVDLLCLFMQKAVDDKLLCGFPDFYVEQAAMGLHTAWNAHSAAWGAIKDLQSYAINQGSVNLRYNFWVKLPQGTEYFEKFLAKAGIKGKAGFNNILGNVKVLLDAFKTRFEKEYPANKPVEDNNDDQDSNKKPEDGDDLGVDVGDKIVQLKVVPGTNSVSSSNGEIRDIKVKAIYLELIFMSSAFDKPKVWYSKQDWKEADVAVKIAVKKDGNTTTIFYPEAVNSGKKASEMVNGTMVVRRNILTSIGLSSDGKSLVQEVSNRVASVEMWSEQPKRRIFNESFTYGKSGVINTVPIPGL